MGSQWSSLFPPPPTLTEKNLPDQNGKVFIVTGGSGGIGKELVTMLYQRHAKVYLAARSATKAESAMEDIQLLHPSSKGQMVYLNLDLNDLTSIKASAEEFLSKETRLDVLWNNAGVMVPPDGSRTAQGYELQFGVNNIAPFLFTHHLLPVLTATAQIAPKDSVRVIWVSSSAATIAPRPAINLANMDYKKDEGKWQKYSRSKAGNVLHAVEFGRRTADRGIISLSLNPGNLLTDLQRTMPRWQYYFLKTFLLYPAKNGAYTELFAGLDPGISGAENGGWVAPWGRLESGRKDLWDPELCQKYWEWTEEQVKPYL